MRINNLEAKEGERVHGFLEIGDGEFSLPAALICGARPGKTVLITAAVHAGEYVGVQAAVRLANRLDPKRVIGNVLIVKVLCREEFEGRYGSLSKADGKNLNREFPGSKTGTRTQRLAYAVEKELHAIADYYIDLHSGDDYEQLTPYVYYPGMAKEDVVKTSRFMAEQVDVPYMVKSNVSSGGSYNYAASLGVPGVLIERGGMGGWTQEEAASTRRDVRNILISLGVYEGKRDYRNYYPIEVCDIRYQAASKGGLWYPRKKAGDLIRAGEVLGEVCDYTEAVQETCYAECSGVILYQAASLQVTDGGPMIAYGRIRTESDERKTRIADYWAKRSEDFLVQRRGELHSPLAGRWMEEISRYVPEGKRLKVLDVGCGTGFFSILLAKAGHDVIGIDLTPDMIRHAGTLAKEEHISCEFRVMDAENPEFSDETFDVIITRNLTWTLPNAGLAYREWLRILKKGGILLNFDANYGKRNFSDTGSLPADHAHNRIENEMLAECESIKEQLPISSYQRPAWDINELGKLGVETFSVDLGISSRIYREKDAWYNPVPMFVLCARK